MTLDELRVLTDRLQNDEEKRLIKLLMEKTFPEMVSYFEGKVEELKQELLAEKRFEINEQEIVIGICEKNQIGVMPEGLYPMRWKDLEQGVTISEEGTLLFPVFVKADEKDIAANCGKQFKGIVFSAGKQYEVAVGLKKDNSYHEIVKALRESFSLSGYSWRPLNDAFLEKFCYFVVQMPNNEDIPLDDDITLEVTDFKLDVYEKTIPVWNIAHVTMQATDFPVIQVDKLKYRYEFHAEEWEELIPDHRTEMLGEFVRRGESFIGTLDGNDRKEFPFWKLYKYDWDEYVGERLLSNGLRRSTVVLNSAGNRVHSPFELDRIVWQLSVSRLLNFRGYKVRPSDYYAHCSEAFDLVEPRKNDYLIEQDENRACLEISFENLGVPQYLFRNVIRFVAEVVQMEFREYQVVAIPVVK